jgi:hypothetical protein
MQFFLACFYFLHIISKYYLQPSVLKMSLAMSLYQSRRPSFLTTKAGQAYFSPFRHAHVQKKSVFNAANTATEVNQQTVQPHLSVLFIWIYLKTSSDTMITVERNGIDVVGRGVVKFPVLCRYLPGRTEENIDESQSR